MKKIFTLLFFLTALTGRSQHLLNFTESDIRIVNHEFTIKTSTLANGNRVLFVASTKTYPEDRWWHFDPKTNRCILFVMRPTTTETKNYYLGLYANTRFYSKFNNRYWQTSQEGMVIGVEWITEADGKDYFRYRIAY